MEIQKRWEIPISWSELGCFLNGNIYVFPLIYSDLKNYLGKFRIALDTLQRANL